MSSEKDSALLQLQLQQGRASLQEAATLGANLAARPGAAPISASVQPQYATAQDRRVFRNTAKPAYNPEGPQPGAFSQPVQVQQADVTPVQLAPPQDDTQTNLADIETTDRPNQESTYWWQKYPILRHLDKQDFYCVTLGTLVIIMALGFMGVALGVKSAHDKEKSPGDNPVNLPPALPMALPTAMPTYPTRPWPTTAPVSAPTDYTAPSVSSAPSLAPTVSPAPTTSPSSSPTWDLNAAKQYITSLLPDNTIQVVQADPNSPQARALEYAALDSVASNTKLPEDWRVLQRFALATLYYSTNGDQWTNHNNWLDYTIPECLWFYHSYNPSIQGVASPCYPQVREERYKRMRLWDNNLVGTLPPELFLLLTDLEQLDLNANRIGNTVPTEIGLLTNLELFTADSNALTGQLPSEIGLLTQLTKLSIQSNAMSGSVPSEIEQLVGLDLAI